MSIVLKVIITISNVFHLCLMTGVFAIRLQGIIADLEHRLEKQMADHGRSIVARDLELEALRQQEEKMRLEIVQLKENTDKLVVKAGFH